MAKICDRSPCDRLLAALGSHVFGSPEGFYELVISEGKEIEDPIEYCKYCGTRLDQVPSITVEKFTRPRKRRRLRQLAVS